MPGAANYDLIDSDHYSTWYEHPTLGREVDVAALPLASDLRPHVDYSETRHFKAVPVNNDVPPATEEPELRIDQTLSIVGFPDGHDGGTPILGISVAGRIASEPSLWSGNKQRFKIDSSTTEGMSGSPVYAHYPAMSLVPIRQEDTFVQIMDDLFVLVGVYSGHLGEHPGLGFVWQADVINQVIDGRKRVDMKAESGLERD